MRDEVFQKMRERYSCYGLGDEMLFAIAEGLARVVSDEQNTDDIVDRMEILLKDLQRIIDKRITNVVDSTVRTTRKELAADIRMLDVKARLAASVFNTLAEHRGCSVMDTLVRESIDAANDIYSGIQEVKVDIHKDISFDDL